jgi:L-lactate permease
MTRRWRKRSAPAAVPAGPVASSAPAPGRPPGPSCPPATAGRRSWPGCPGSCWPRWCSSGHPQVKSFLNDLSTTLHLGTKINWPWLHLEVVRTPPVVPKDTAEKAVYDFFPLSATGTALLLTGILSGLALRLRPGEIGRVFLGNLRRVRFSLLTIAAMLAIGYVTRYGGLDASMGLAFAKTGKLFAFFSPLLGWLGGGP